MPDGLTHDRLWSYGQALAYPASAIFAFSSWPIAVGSVLGYWAGRFIGPDMDLVGITYGEGEMMRRFGCLGGILVSYFTFYGFVFRGSHRSFWTHGIILSTAIRFIYTFWIPALLMYNRQWLSYSIYLGALGIFLGMCFSDFIHIIADWASPDTKRRNRWNK